MSTSAPARPDWTVDRPLCPVADSNGLWSAPPDLIRIDTAVASAPVPTAVWERSRVRHAHAQLVAWDYILYVRVDHLTGDIWLGHHTSRLGVNYRQSMKWVN